MHGTWKVTGYGLGPVLAVFAGVALIEGLEWLLAWLWLIALLAAAAAVVTALAVAWLMRWAQRRDAQPVPLWRPSEVASAPPAQLHADPAAALPRADRPAITAQPISLSIYVADVGQAAALIRQALPGTAGEPATGREP